MTIESTAQPFVVIAPAIERHKRTMKLSGTASVSLV